LKKIAIICCIGYYCLNPLVGLSQDPDSQVVKQGVVHDGDTIAVNYLPAIDIFGDFDPDAAERLRKYLRLRRDVIRAYPYAKLAAAQLKYVNDSIPKIKSKRAQKKFIKKTEKQLKEKFAKDLKKLSRNQGFILIKLIDRETGDTSYSLVKELRGSLNAFFWQSLARLFGSNMKAEYDPEGEDALIESIVQAIERGEISVVKK
jgi:uncharacterized protein DUF4294